jgi:hypothetical protein
MEPHDPGQARGPPASVTRLRTNRAQNGNYDEKGAELPGAAVAR